MQGVQNKFDLIEVRVGKLLLARTPKCGFFERLIMYLQPLATHV